MTTEDIIRTVIEAYDRGDKDAVDALVDDHVTYRINSHDGPYRADCCSREEFWDAVGEILADWEVTSYKLADLIVSETKGAAQIDVEMTSRHTGRSVGTGLALFLEVRNGKLVYIHEYHDTRVASTSKTA